MQIIQKVTNHFNNSNPKLNNMNTWNSLYKQIVPKQNNVVDCGIFVCLFARHIILNSKFDFDQSTIKKWREHTCD